MIQLRDKNASPRDFYRDALEALEISRRYGVKILINDRVDMALATQADGVHVGQDDLSPEHARKLLGDKAMIGYSTHSVEQAIEARRYPVDYIAIGPIYATRTKESPDDVIGLEGIREVRRTIGEFPLVAIGGINEKNLGDTLEAGADSAAVISYLLSEAEDITRKMKELTATYGI